MDVTDRKPWERIDGETSRAWEGFVSYRDMGPERSLSKVARQLSKSKQLLQRWSSRWLWVMRVRAWDDHMDERLRQAHEDEVIAMRKRHVQLALGVQGIGAEAFKRMHKKERETSGSISDNLEAVDAMKLVKEGITLERVARGEPGTVEETRETDVDSAIQREATRILSDPSARRELDRAGARARGTAVDAGVDGGGSEREEVDPD